MGFSPWGIRELHLLLSAQLLSQFRSPDCTLTRTMFFSQGAHHSRAGAALAASISTALLALASAQQLPAQAAQAAQLPASEPHLVALPLPEDRGEAKLEQTLKRLGTTASIMMIVAHPDDEDGALLTYLSRGMGVRATLFTLTRGEGGQNAMSAELYDALGIIRTNELLKADQYYGAKQLWGTEVDFGFSKTQEESFQKWGHDRVLYDAVLAVRRERPQVSSPPSSAASPTATGSTRSPVKSPRKSSRLPPIPTSSLNSSSPSPQAASVSSPGSRSPFTR